MMLPKRQIGCSSELMRGYDYRRDAVYLPVADDFMTSSLGTYMSIALRYLFHITLETSYMMLTP